MMPNDAGRWSYPKLAKPESDGAFCYHVQRRVYDLWTLNVSDPDSAVAGEYLSSEFNLRDIMISPDGTLAAYTSDEQNLLSHRLFRRRYIELLGDAMTQLDELLALLDSARAT